MNTATTPELKGRRLAAIIAYWQMGMCDARSRRTAKWLGPYGSTVARVDAAYARHAQ